MKMKAALMYGPNDIRVEETDKPILFEVFTNSDDESTALKLLKSVNGVSQKQTKAKTKIKNALNKLRKLF